MMNRKIYKHLETDFKHKLDRELTEIEKEFFKWIAEKHVSEQDKKNSFEK
ncbi:hypothetical protein J18TS1_03380 [Oceanobacillus oncorhynchi subsp. incaldanensis]|nr:hypothetical protein [Oceanobacillus oncorhynchi]UUI38062.1 hypothetical protein NP440_11900 [Oceanobacillus oncorhynchi]GIO17238.1 hypothetical protein J18TS1_03380 [Oceanobacillus oncorhynchi subsp. incaldanensis]